MLQDAIFSQSHRYDEEYEVDLKKDSGGLGIEIAGVEHEGLQGIVISSIVVGGPADKTKKMKIGDQILRVNGWDTTVYVCVRTYVRTYLAVFIPYICTYGPFSTNVQLENGCACICTCVGTGVLHLIFVLHTVYIYTYVY